MSLFNWGFNKKTSTTPPSEVEAAKAAREAQEEASRRQVCTSRDLAPPPLSPPPEAATLALRTSKKPSVCFILSCTVPAVANIGSFCTTDNHWADDVTSKAFTTRPQALAQASDLHFTLVGCLGGI